MVSIVGLGIDPSDLTEGAKQELLSGKKIIVRAERFAAAVRALGVSFETLDCVYESSRNFDSLHKNLAARVLGAAKERDVVYCVPGSVEEDISAQIVLKKSRGAAVFDSVSKSADAFRRAKIFSCNRAAYSAYDLEKYIRAVLPLCVYDIDCDLVAGDVKLKLCDMLGDETPCFFVKNGKVKKIKLYELDRQKEYDETTALVVDDTPLLKKKRFDFYDLCEVMRRLRAPGGCPWDRAQTHESIRKNMVEEAYELVDAIDSKDDGKIVEEAGDVLMQAVFHAQLGEDRGAFDCADVTSGVCEKLIFRHSHIFGGDNAKNADDALSVWERNKRAEKGQKTTGDSVADVPAGFPALLRAQKVGKRASKAGYDFKDIEEAAEKIGEELSELLQAVKEGDAAHISEETGDLLFSAVNVGRLAGADCEESLHESTKKFVARFLKTENLILQDGKEMQNLAPEELWAYYERAKEQIDADPSR